MMQVDKSLQAKCLSLLLMVKKGALVYTLSHDSSKQRRSRKQAEKRSSTKRSELQRIRGRKGGKSLLLPLRCDSVSARVMSRTPWRAASQCVTGRKKSMC